MANFTLSACLDVMADTGVDKDEAKREKIAEQTENLANLSFCLDQSDEMKMMLLDCSSLCFEAIAQRVTLPPWPPGRPRRNQR